MQDSVKRAKSGKFDTAWLSDGTNLPVPPAEKISLKPFIIAFILIPLNCYWLMQLELVRYTLLSNVVPLSNVIFLLLILTAFNGMLQKFFPSISLNQGELLIIYIILSLATTFCSICVVGAITSTMGHAFWFATPENEWKELFWRYIPRWLTVDDKSVLSGYYKGDSNLYTTEYLKAWLPPILWWVFIIFILGFTMLCINVVMRRQWSEREKLTYPIIKLPTELTSPKLGFFKNRMLFFGFGIAAFISLLNGLSFLYPSIPSIPVTRRFYRFYERPLSLIGSDGVEPASTTIAFYPFAIGIGFLMPLSVMSSTLFFFAFYRAQIALGALTSNRVLWRYQSEQIFGTLIGLCILLIWIGREHLAAVIKTALGVGKRLNDSEEPMRYRTAFFGAILGLILLFFLLLRAGMSLWVIPIFLFFYFLISFVITRIRAESGIYVHCFNAQEPRYMMSEILGTRLLGHRNLTVLAVSFFNYSFRAHQMPHQLEAFQIAKQRQIGRKPLIVSILLTTLIGTLIAFFVELSVYYKVGAASGHFSWMATGLGEYYFRWLQNSLVYTTAKNNTALSFMGIGFFLLIFIAYMRTRFIWWPFHPLGLIMAGNDEMEDLWLPILLCWVIKRAILKYGGHRAYRRAVPFFLGLALGDFTLGSIWSILSMILNRNMYVYFP